jgi:hypothetical protein
MKPLFWVGLVLLVMGIGSLFVPVPQQERHGVEVGDVEIGVQTKTERRVPPLLSGVLILGGIALMGVGGRGRA